MKDFFKHIITLLIILILTAFLLDICYTYVYSNNSNRNKVQRIINGPAEEYDVVFMGSSRANNHLVTKIFTEKGLRAYNYGISGSRLQEANLLLQLMLEKGYKIKNLILEVDLNINSDGFSDGTRALFMPYIKNSNTIENYYDSIPDFDKLRYIPFYRYIIYDSKIGFREFAFTKMNKKSSLLDNGGFYALRNSNTKLDYDISKYYPKRNPSYERIKDLCIKYNINLVSITTPVCQETKGRNNYFKKITKIYPEIIHFEDVIKEDKYFSSCGHMNYMGAKLFTKRILQQIVLKK